MDENTVKPLKELLDSVRNIEGFPKGKDEDILALSDPPYYTACPNPYIPEFVKKYGHPYNLNDDDYHKEPFIGDVSEGKRDGLSTAHYYITKVPFKAIIYFILHYTQPGDIILDPFSGSGMTGVASQLCENPPDDLKERIEKRMGTVNYGYRRPLLIELSPFASFITANYNSSMDDKEIAKIGLKILDKVEEECNWMWKTSVNLNSIENSQAQTTFGKEQHLAKVNHIIWSDVFICPFCSNEYVLWDTAINTEIGDIVEPYSCPSCGADLTKNNSERFKVKMFDKALNKTIDIAKQVPVQINFNVGSSRYNKKPDKEDMELINKITQMEIPYWFPVIALPDGHNTKQPILSHGFTHLHHFYTWRNLWAISKIYDEIQKINNISIRNKLMFVLTSFLLRASKKAIVEISNYFHGGGGYITTISSNLYVPSVSAEVPVIEQFKERLKKTNRINEYKELSKNRVIVSLNSSTDLKLISNDSVDYIFTDPPFGSNLMYSELNFLIEPWLKVIQNNEKEAIINSVQNKEIFEYTELMTGCFKEMFRVLKPNRWVTIMFHNSKASIWNAIQESLTRAGFIIAQVAVLDKKTGSFMEHVSPGAVKNDLVINAYKPSREFSQRFLKNAGEGMEVDFVTQQLEHLPVKPNIERTEKMLYSKMLAHYVENGFKIKYDSTNFYKLLSDNFIDLDGYWFLDSQVKEYNEWKSGLSLDKIKEVLDGQQVLFVSDEKSALTWMYNFLHQPRTYSEIYTAYQQVATTTGDRIPEPRELVENNFIQEDGKYRRPISREEREDINKNRERELDRAFQRLLKQAKEQKGKIKNIRREALIHGFTKCYQKGKYDDILTVADKLYASTLEASGDIMDFIDIARIKTSGEKDSI